MRKKSITLLLIPFFVIFSVGLQRSDNLSVQSCMTTDTNNLLTIAASWSPTNVISDDKTGWNDGASNNPAIATDGDGNIHVVWYDATNGAWGTDTEIMYANHTGVGWSNPTVISDDVTGWNDGGSYGPDIAIDGDGNVHVVWYDGTDGEWGTDFEIMYANNTGSGWSNATVISDDATGWNDGVSSTPSIAIDGNGNVHVVWQDNTVGEWGIDDEIMYVNFTGSGWSNATVISDDGTGWNDGQSNEPKIAIDGDGNVHVVWYDFTQSPGEWGTDPEIMYTKYTSAGWSNATVISDDITGWNDGFSKCPDIAIDDDGNVHVVWDDDTNGEWGIDVEIMYANNTGTGWSNATVISDDATGWNDGISWYPKIAIDGDGNVHVVWQDKTDGEWTEGMYDDEIMYTKYTGVGWFNATAISDMNGWNDWFSDYPDIAIDGDGNVHVVWRDDTNGTWGTDTDIFYSNKTVTQKYGEQETFTIIYSPDSSISLLSALGLGIIGIVAATAVIITVVITKKKK